MELLDAVRRGLDRAGVEAGASIAVACSGGPDSVALADLLRREGRAGELSLIYVDHQLRPTDREAALVAGLAGRWGIEHRVVAVDVDETTASLEAAARAARYRALEATAAELGASLIATGHTASDQAETLLLRIVRGTGVEGLSGIARRRGAIIRPLLDVSRADVEGYIAARGLETATDPTNASPRFSRNRVRHQIMPILAGENPQIEIALCRLAGSAAELRAVVDGAVAGLRERAGGDGGLRCDRLAAAPAVIAKRLLAETAAAAGLKTLEAEHLDALWDLVTRDAAGTVALDLPGGVVVREYDTLRFGEGPEPPAAAIEVDGPARYEVRTWRPGDRMRPARLGGRSKKLSDLFIDAKVPRRLREAARVVVREADGVIEWAEHLGAAHQSPVTVRLVRRQYPRPA